MFQDLTRLLFVGEFYRDPHFVGEEIARRQVNQQDLDLYLKENDLVNSHHKFQLRILDYDSSSGLFVAKAHDPRGFSGIVGVIREGTIEFQKAYVSDNFRVSPDAPSFVQNLSIVEYSGQITQPDSVITAGGRYRIKGLNERYEGIWRMDSVDRQGEVFAPAMV